MDNQNIGSQNHRNKSYRAHQIRNKSQESSEVRRSGTLNPYYLASDISEDCNVVDDAKPDFNIKKTTIDFCEYRKDFNKKWILNSSDSQKQNKANNDIQFATEQQNSPVDNSSYTQEKDLNPLLIHFKFQSSSMKKYPHPMNKEESMDFFKDMKCDLFNSQTIECPHSVYTGDVLQSPSGPENKVLNVIEKKINKSNVGIMDDFFDTNNHKSLMTPNQIFTNKKQTYVKPPKRVFNCSELFDLDNFRYEHKHVKRNSCSQLNNTVQETEISNVNLVSERNDLKKDVNDLSDSNSQILDNDSKNYDEYFSNLNTIGCLDYDILKDMLVGGKLVDPQADYCIYDENKKPEIEAFESDFCNYIISNKPFDSFQNESEVKPESMISKETPEFPISPSLKKHKQMHQFYAQRKESTESNVYKITECFESQECSPMVVLDNIQINNQKKKLSYETKIEKINEREVLNMKDNIVGLFASCEQIERDRVATKEPHSFILSPPNYLLLKDYEKDQLDCVKQNIIMLNEIVINAEDYQLRNKLNSETNTDNHLLQKDNDKKTLEDIKVKLTVVNEKVINIEKLDTDRLNTQRSYSKASLISDSNVETRNNYNKSHSSIRSSVEKVLKFTHKIEQNVPKINFKLNLPKNKILVNTYSISSQRNPFINSTDRSISHKFDSARYEHDNINAKGSKNKSYYNGKRVLRNKQLDYGNYSIKPKERKTETKKNCNVPQNHQIDEDDNYGWKPIKIITEPNAPDNRQQNIESEVSLQSYIKEVAKGNVRKMGQEVYDKSVGNYNKKELEENAFEFAQQKVRNPSNKICDKFLQQLKPDKSSIDNNSISDETFAKIEIENIANKVLTESFESEQDETFAKIEIENITNKVLTESYEDEQHKRLAKSEVKRLSIKILTKSQEEEQVEIVAKIEIENLTNKVLTENQEQEQAERIAKIEIKNLTKKILTKSQLQEQDEKIAKMEVKNLTNKIIIESQFQEQDERIAKREIKRLSIKVLTEGYEKEQDERVAKIEIKNIGNKILTESIKKDKEKSKRRSVAKRNVRRISKKIIDSVIIFL